MRVFTVILALAIAFALGALVGYSRARVNLEREVIDLNKAFYGLK